MVQMMGTQLQASSDALAGLLRLVRDPAAVEAHLAEIQKAENDYRALVESASSQIAAQQAELADRRGAQERRETALAQREAAVGAREAAASAADAALAKKRSEFENFETQTSARLAQEEIDLRTALGLHDEAVKQWTAKIDAREADVNARLADVTTQKRDLDNREALLIQREQDYEARAKALRSALGAAA